MSAPFDFATLRTNGDRRVRVRESIPDVSIVQMSLYRLDREHGLHVVTPVDANEGRERAMGSHPRSS